MKPATIARPVSYPTRRPLLQRLQPALAALVALLAVALLVTGAAGLVARLHATQAQIDAAHLQGIALGQRMCGSR